MLNAPVGVQRVIGRLRRSSSEGSTPAITQTRSRDVAAQVRGHLREAAGYAHFMPTRSRRRSGPAARPLRVSLVGRIGHDRLLAVLVAGIVLLASVASVSASGSVSPKGKAPVGGTSGDGAAPRLAVGGVLGADQSGTTDQTGSVDAAYPSEPAIAAQIAAANALVDQTTVQGPFLEDGTLLKPVAVDTTVNDGKALLRTYKVRSGDTLTGIAGKFGVSMMTIWWANSLKNKDGLHIGQVLTIPPVSGLVLTVKATDTLESISARYDIDPAAILAENGIQDPNLVVGQVLVIPGAAGQGIAVPKPRTVSRPVVVRTQSSGGGGGGGSGAVHQPHTYSGGTMLWPVVGGNNYISQYFHYGHEAIDIAADYGSEVRAAAGGTVIYAGWKDNGGGYQVWISHGSDLFTTYNHMSAITVGRGQSVGRGQQVGRIGQSGNATGPHLHFEVWRGPVWNGGTRVNPLGYL